MTYKLAFYNKNSEKDWQKLPENIKEIFKKHLKKRMENPHVASARLSDELEDCYKIKLRKEGYRLVYQVEDNKLLLILITAGKRERSAAYKRAIGILQKLSTY